MRGKIELGKNRTQFSLPQKQQILKKLNQAVVFEQFLDKKYVVAPFEYTIHADPFKDWAKTNVYEDWWNWPSPKNLTGFWDWDVKANGIFYSKEWFAILGGF